MPWNWQSTLRFDNIRPAPPAGSCFSEHAALRLHFGRSDILERSPKAHLAKEFSYLPRADMVDLRHDMDRHQPVAFQYYPSILERAVPKVCKIGVIPNLTAFQGNLEFRSSVGMCSAHRRTWRGWDGLSERQGENIKFRQRMA